MRKKGLWVFVVVVLEGLATWWQLPVIKDRRGAPAIDCMVGGVLRLYRDEHGANPATLTALGPYLKEAFPRSDFRIREIAPGEFEVALESGAQKPVRYRRHWYADLEVYSYVLIED